LLFVPVLVGFAVMLAGGAPLARWGVHVAAALLGWFAYLIIQQLPGDGAWMGSRWLPIVGVGLVGSTLLAADIDGVNRWHLVGPLRLHFSALLTPVLVVVAAGAVRVRPIATGVMLTACQLVHLAQPDAGQATALGAAGAWVLMKGTTSPVARGQGIASAAAGAIVWMRPDRAPSPRKPRGASNVPHRFTELRT
jgi:cell division protein FtsW (lipid II flippase)